MVPLLFSHAHAGQAVFSLCEPQLGYFLHEGMQGKPATPQLGYFLHQVCLENKNKNKPTMGQNIANGANSAPRDFDCVVVIFVVVIVVIIAIVIVMIFVILVMIKRLHHHHHHQHQISTVTISCSVSAPPWP